MFAFVPVLHEGYYRFFQKHADVEVLYLFGDALINEFERLRKEIRTLLPPLVQSAVKSWGIFNDVQVADHEIIDFIQKIDGISLIMPDEDASRNLAEKYFRKHTVHFDSVFLRWDSKNSVLEKNVFYDKRIQGDQFHEEIMNLAFLEGEKSSDWWRHIGAFAVRDGEILVAGYNRHVPSPHTPYAFGDPRSNFKKGLHIELSSANHAEAEVVCAAARSKDISLKGADLYVTTFPCPPCAKLVAYSGIKRLFYKGGYAMLDGEEILKVNNVEIVLVE